jgi:hypothetical protein
MKTYNQNNISGFGTTSKLAREPFCGVYADSSLVLLEHCSSKEAQTADRQISIYIRKVARQEIELIQASFKENAISAATLASEDIDYDVDRILTGMNS